MPNIQVNTDMLRSLSQLFVNLNNQMNEIGSQIHNQTSQLEGGWQGVSRGRFDSMYQDWSSRASGITQAHNDLHTHLQNTAQQLESADQSM